MERTMMMLIGDTYKLWTEHMKSIALASGIPDSYRMVLTYLLYNPQASQKEIAEYRNIRMASVSRTIKEMQLNGYLEKESDENDLRYVKLTLTEKGRQCAESIQRQVDQSDEQILRQFGADKEQEIIRQMRELSAIIAQLSANPDRQAEGDDPHA